MRIKRLSKQLFIISLGIFILTAADNIFDSATVYAADTSTISTSSTRSEVQEVVDEGNFDYTQLSDAEIDHIYSLYGNDPETIRQLQKQSDSANPYGVATLSSTTYTHASQFKNSTVMKGIDVSEWNGSINWRKVKSSGVTFAFIRAGGRYYGSGAYFVDSKFAENVKNATAAGIDVGAYFYSQAINAAEARQEAAYTLNIVSSYNLTLPIVMDYEYAWEGGLTGRLYNAHLSKSAATTVINTFCSTVEASGYVGMLYASKSVITDDMKITSINNKYPIWNAQYNDSDTLTATHSYWQYDDNGTVAGISYPTDLDFKYVNTPAAPTELTFKSSTNSSITLTWNKVPEVYGYQIVRYDEAEGKYVSIGTTKGAGTLTYTDNGLTSGKKYTYMVRGYHKLNTGTVYGAYSQEYSCTATYAEAVTASTDPEPPIFDTAPDMPTQAAIADRTSSSINVRWSKISGVTGYFVYKYNTSTGKYDRIARCIGDKSRSYNFTGLSPATTYKFGVRAYYEYNGVIMYSNRLEFSKCTKPRTFTSSFKYTPLGSYRCLHWQKLSNVSGYIIYKYDIAHNKYTRVKKISSYKTTSCILPALKSGFGYRILAYKNVNGSIVYGDISKAPAKASSLSGTVIDSQVRLRAGAGTNKRIIQELARGSKVKISGCKYSGKNAWYKITYTKGSKKYTGYVRSDFIRIN